MSKLKDIHIGSLIAQQMRKKGYSYAKLANELNLDRSTVYWIIKQKSIDVERLVKISQILQYDFLSNVYLPCLLFKLPVDINLNDIKNLIETLPPGIKVSLHIAPNNEY